MPVLNNQRHERLDRIKAMVAYDPSTGVMTWLVDYYRVKAGDRAGQKHPQGYWMVTVGRNRMLAHRLAWAMCFGVWPDRQIDHINGDRMDNRICNLRLATPAENSRNGKLRSTNTSGLKGASRIGNRWRATITVDGKQHSLGRHDTPEAAHQAYVDAAHRLHGEYARAA